MPLFKSAPAPVPTLEERHNAAAATAEAALSTFARVVDDLERAADDHESVRQHASAEIDRLAELETQAIAAREAARDRARRIRDLVG